MTSQSSPTRRGFLALAGAAALSGCGALGLGDGDDPVELDGAALATVGSEAPPSVSDPLLVDVADSHLEASRERARDSLDAVPLPLSAADVPNGVMRERLNQAATDAREALSAAGDATTVRERLDALREAREHARFVAAAWAFVDDGLTRAEVRESAETVAADAREYRDGRRYLGADPVRALLVHDTVESWTASVERAVRSNERRRSATNAVTVGEAAGHVERGRAYLADARHVDDQFRDSLSNPESVRSTLAEARETLTATVESRRRELPGRDAEAGDLVDAEVGETVARQALRDLHRRLPGTDSLAPSDDLAGDVVRRYDDLVTVAAFESLRDRVEGGERFTVEDVDDVRNLRSRAVTAIESALVDSDDERLARDAVENWDEWIARADDDLTRYGETVEVRWIHRELAVYVQISALARAVPSACAETLDALEVS